MAIELTAMEQALFEEAKTFALKNIAPFSADWENGDKLPKEAFDILNKNGYCGLLVSEALGVED